MEENYVLYVGRLQAIPDGVRFSFYNDEHQYLLIFSDVPPEGDFIVVGDELMESLSERELLWLLGCKATINAEHVARNGEQYIDDLYSCAEELEYQLRSEYEKKYREELR